MVRKYINKIAPDLTFTQKNDKAKTKIESYLYTPPYSTSKIGMEKVKV